MSKELHLPKEHVLLALLGVSPAVITETVYAMAKQQDCPDKVVVITTTTGRTFLERELFESGVWDQLIRELGRNISFCSNHEHFRLLPGEQDDASDITDSPATERAADFILETLRQFTENPDVRITFSIAGGRKSMTALGALCMSLLGRSDDRLCHILINAPFDRPDLQPKFYYPVKARCHRTAEGVEVEAAAAQLQLSYIAFVRCRYLIQKELQQMPGHYSRMVASANRNAALLEPDAVLELYCQEQRVRWGATEFELQPRLFALYWMLAERCHKGEPAITAPGDLCDEFTDFADRVCVHMTSRFRYEYGKMAEGGDAGNLIKRISDLTAVLKQNGLPCSCWPTQARGVYGLSLEPERVLIRNSAGIPKDGL